MPSELYSQINNVEINTKSGGVPFRAICLGCRAVWRSSSESYHQWLNGHRTHEEYHHRA